MELAVIQCMDEAVKMFFDVLGRKDKADKTRNALLVLKRYKMKENIFVTPPNMYFFLHIINYFSLQVTLSVAGGSAECRAAEEAGQIADPDPAAGRLEDTCLVTIL